jgi:hypothetical protein
MESVSIQNNIVLPYPEKNIMTLEFFHKNWMGVQVRWFPFYFLQYGRKGIAIE